MDCENERNDILVCFAIGMALLYPVFLIQSIQVDERQLNSHLRANDWMERVSALKRIYRTKSDIRHYDYPNAQNPISNSVETY